MLCEVVVVLISILNLFTGWPGAMILAVLAFAMAMGKFVIGLADKNLGQNIISVLFWCAAGALNLFMAFIS